MSFRLIHYNALENSYWLSFHTRMIGRWVGHEMRKNSNKYTFFNTTTSFYAGGRKLCWRIKNRPRMNDSLLFNIFGWITFKPFASFLIFFMVNFTRSITYAYPKGEICEFTIILWSNYTDKELTTLCVICIPIFPNSFLSFMGTWRIKVSPFLFRIGLNL